MGGKTVSVYAIHTDEVRRMDWTPLYDSMPRRMARAAGVRNEAELRLGPYGKPYRPGRPAFSLSHSGEWCVLAKGDGEIGVDIEGMDRRGLHVAARVLSPEELRWMSDDPLPRFYTLWTWKESVMKATGQGMNLEPRSFEALPFVRKEPIVVDELRWYGATGGIEGYRFGICAPWPVEDLSWYQWDAELSLFRADDHMDSQFSMLHSPSRNTEQLPFEQYQEEKI